jgi:hypothetical protein
MLFDFCFLSSDGIHFHHGGAQLPQGLKCTKTRKLFVVESKLFHV